MRYEVHDRRILDHALTWLRANKQVTLITLTRTGGTGPRQEGSLLAISSAADIAGSVSGGCIEDDLISRYTRQPAKQIEHLIYGSNSEEANRFQLPCGARVELIAEAFNNQQHIEKLIEHIENRNPICRNLNLKTGSIELAPPSADIINIKTSEESVQRIFGPSWQALLIGANDLSTALIPLLDNLGFKTQVCDPRNEYLNSWRNNPITADQDVSELEPEEWLEGKILDQHTIILFLSHEAKIEDLAILKAIQSDLLYAGALGSMRTTQSRQQRLIEHFDAQTEWFEKFDAPIGFDLGSRTSPEIAIAIAAKIILVRNQSLKILEENSLKTDQ